MSVSCKKYGFCWFCRVETLISESEILSFDHFIGRWIIIAQKARRVKFSRAEI